ncbi:putative transposase B [Vibrio ichthyoenteri ATCC 700023]|uniref:Putative transposase B n=1 Tax=Vibrio ichthyoenteri ATCC 700023 TaxID=870968 RepID=F9S6E1_9VIBR|nr:putative transposase B [Vibrio ichthyoenteri ATCC 700023]
MTSIPFYKANITLICEVNEQWSFVCNKKNRRWLWYAWEPRYKGSVDHWRQQQEWINKPEVVIHAELLSERGEGFLQQFAQRFDYPSHLTLVRDWGW